MNHIPKHILRAWAEEAMAYAALPAGALDVFEKILYRKAEQARAGFIKPGISPKSQPIKELPDSAPSPDVKDDIATFLEQRKRGRVFHVNSSPRVDIDDVSPTVTS